MLVVLIISGIILMILGIVIIMLMHEIDRKRLQISFLYEKIDTFENKLNNVNQLLNQYSRLIQILENVCSRILSVYK